MDYFQWQHLNKKSGKKEGKRDDILSGEGAGVVCAEVWGRLMAGWRSGAEGCREAGGGTQGLRQTGRQAANGVAGRRQQLLGELEFVVKEQPCFAIKKPRSD